MKKIQIVFFMKRVFKSSSAFSLIETLAAVTILAIGLLAVAKMQITAIKGNYFSDKTSVALHLAEQKLEDLLQMAWDDAELANDEEGNDDDLTNITDPDHEELHVEENGVVGAGLYHRVWNVTNTSTPIANTKTICVIVTWGPNDRHRVELISIKYNSTME